MRHNYNFDDSEVMREFANIAANKGLVKQASDEELLKEAGPAANEMRQTINQLMRSKNPFMDATQAMNKFHAKYYGKIPNQRLGLFLGRIRDAVVAHWTKAYANNPEVQAAAQKFHTEVTNAWVTPLTHAKLPELDLTKQQSAEMENMKTAEEKLYDVSGETGEQLVDKAHPGGGTRTELTHSKTDENLVETIVEQQKKDVEVALSMPKGTYAALLNLADRLDKLGYVKAADRVDSLLKKKVKVAASPAAQQFKKQVLDALNQADLGGRFNKPMVIREWQGTSMPTLTEAMSALQKLQSRWGKNAPDLPSVVQPMVAQWSPNLQAEQQMLAQRRQQQDSGVATTQQKVDPQTGFPTTPEGWEAAGAGEINLDESGTATTQDKKKMRLTQLQNRLRTMVGLQPKANQPFDRQLANVLRQKYPDAWAAVKSKAGFRAIFDAVQNQGAGTAKKEETAPGEAQPQGPSPQAAEQLMLQTFQKRFPRLPLRRAPELEQALRTRARESYKSMIRFFTPEAAMGKLEQEFAGTVKSLTPDQIKQFINI